MPNSTLSLMMRNAGTLFFVASALRQARSAASILSVLGEVGDAFFCARGGELDFARGFAVARERRPFLRVATFLSVSTLFGTWIAANVCAFTF